MSPSNVDPSGKPTLAEPQSQRRWRIVLVVPLALAVLAAAAVGELLHVLVIAAGVIVGIGAVCVGGLLAWRWHRPRLDAARATPPTFAEAKVVRAVPPLPQGRTTRCVPA